MIKKESSRVRDKKLAKKKSGDEKNLFEIQGFIIDLDGVMYLDQKLLPFAKKSFINFLNKNNKKYIFLTNDSSVSPMAIQSFLEN